MNDVSIIIPVYNAEEYIEKCIVSVLSQTYSDFELILVNDGSKDRTLEICQNYEESDNRIRVITQKNRGVSSARNRGLEIANGKWIAFIDADDFVDRNYIESLYRHTYNEQKQTLIIQGYKKIKEKECVHKKEFSNNTLQGICMQSVFDNGLIFEYGQPWGKLYNKTVIDKNRIRFNEKISYSEDLIFMLKYILHCNCIKFIDGFGYNYVTDASNLSQQYNSFESEYLLFNEYTRIIWEIAAKWRTEPSYQSQRCGALMLMRSIYSLYKKNIQDKKDRITIVKEIKAKHKSYISHYYSPKILLLKIFKIIFMTNIYLFDFCCYHKFNKKG